MKAQNMTIDINRLDTDQLAQIAAMLYETRPSADLVKAVNDRIAFLSGWMSEKAEAEYAERFC